MILPLTARQLLDNTPGVVKMRTKVCSIRLSKKGNVEEPKLGKCYKMVYKVRCLDGDRTTTLKYIGELSAGLGEDRDQKDGIPGRDSQVWVSCTCPYHLFNTEYALTHHENSDILYSNGEPARVRNPNNVGFVCKHVVLALEKSFSDSGEKPKRPIKDPTKPTKEAPIKEPEVPSEEPAILRPSRPTKLRPTPENITQPVEKPPVVDKIKEDPAVLQPKVEPKQIVPSEEPAILPPKKEPIVKDIPKKDTTKEAPSWKKKLTDWLTAPKKEIPKGKAPTSWKDRLTNWMAKK